MALANPLHYSLNSRLGWESILVGWGWPIGAIDSWTVWRLDSMADSPSAGHQTLQGPMSLSIAAGVKSGTEGPWTVRSAHVRVLLQ